MTTLSNLPHANSGKRLLLAWGHIDLTQNDSDSDVEFVYLDVTRAYSAAGLIANKLFQIGETGGEAVIIKDVGWAVKSVEWV